MGAWLLAALALALHRTPYDDEWFSFELAARTDWSHFWAWLQRERHPPWVALLDRAVVELGLGRGVMHATRILASACAVGATSEVLRRRLALPRWAAILAAFHPIVLLYAGALRWYPFFFLGQALCAWAIWGTKATQMRRLAWFCAGAMLVSASSYLGLAFAGLELAWLVWRLHGEGVVWGRIATAAIAGVGAMLLPHLVSPLGISHAFSHLSSNAAAHWKAWATLGWALGPAGEAHPPWPWLLAAPVAHVATVWGWVRVKREQPALAWWLLSLATLWLFCTSVAVWHPRYSLGLWLWAVACWAMLWRPANGSRVVLGAAVAYACVSLVFTVQGRGFFKVGMMEIDTAACRRLLGREDDEDVIVASYARVHALLGKTCQPSTPILHLPFPQHYPERGEQMSVLRAALELEHVRRVRFVRRVRSPSALAITHRRARALLESRCTREEVSRAVPTPHYDIKSRLKPGIPEHYLQSELWVCPPR